jgi:hypothetical protein
MKLERRRKLTKAEWAAITSSRPVLQRVLDRGEAASLFSSKAPPLQDRGRGTKASEGS